MSWQNGLSQYEQIGNAVPPKLGKELGISVKLILDEKTAIATDDKLSMNMTEQTSLFPSNQSNLLENKNKLKISKRGRTSKYAHIYKKIMSLEVGKSLEIPLELPDEFFVFLNGAMHRRRIRYAISDRILTKIGE